MVNLNTNTKILIYLLRCAVNKTAPERREISGLKSDSLLSVCRFHNITALVAYALEPLLGDRTLFSAEQETTWKKEKNTALRRAVLYDAEKASIFSYLDSQGIWYTPLKGSVLQNYYPEYGLREMVDVDVLFDQSRSEQLHDYMVSQGYSVRRYKQTHHDVYLKPPIFTFEFHRTLVAEHNKKLFAYYKDIENKLIKSGGSSSERRMTKEDFYIYITAHACKHFTNGGIGLRILMDFYICGKVIGYNRQYVEKELKKVDLFETEHKLRNLSMKLFDESSDFNDLTPSEEVLLNYILESGSLGIFKHRIQNKVNKASSGKNGKTSRLRYLRKRIFISPELGKYNYPFFYEHKLARPFLIFHRAFLGLTKHRKRLKAEYTLIKEMEKKNK